MPLEDIRWVLQQVREFCSQNGMELISYPMHEVVNHPQAVEVLKLFQEIVSPHEKFVDPLPTTGVPIAIRPDWQELLDGIRDLGVTALFFAFHGVGEVHDRFVNRAESYDETCLAVRRARSRGLKVGANVFVTKEMVPQVDELATTLDELGITDRSWDVARYSPVSRVRRYEQSRPELSDLLPVATKIAEMSPVNSDVWTNLQDYTEAAYVRMALNNDEADFECVNRIGIRIVCRGNMDVHSGDAKLYGDLHGNLKKDGTAQVFTRAVGYGPVSSDSLFFSSVELPSVTDLAKTVGNAQGQQIYFDTASVRYRWLDLALGKVR
jgi:hypothetical protein